MCNVWTSSSAAWIAPISVHCLTWPQVTAPACLPYDLPAAWITTMPAHSTIECAKNVCACWFVKIGWRNANAKLTIADIAKLISVSLECMLPWYVPIYDIMLCTTWPLPWPIFGQVCLDRNTYPLTGLITEYQPFHTEMLSVLTQLLTLPKTANAATACALAKDC